MQRGDWSSHGHAAGGSSGEWSSDSKTSRMVEIGAAVGGGGLYITAVRGKVGVPLVFDAPMCPIQIDLEVLQSG